MHLRCRHRVPARALAPRRHRRARTRIRPGRAVAPGGVMESPVIGIDVSKSELTIAVYPSGTTWTSATTPAALDGLVTRLTALTPTLVVLEATGGYETTTAAACAGAGLRVAVVNRRQ